MCDEGGFSRLSVIDCYGGNLVPSLLFVYRFFLGLIPATYQLRRAMEHDALNDEMLQDRLHEIILHHTLHK